MRALHLVSSLDPQRGGVSAAIRAIAPPLRQLGCFSDVVTTDSPGSAWLTDDDDFCIHALGPGISPWNFSKWLVPWLYSHLIRYDVVIIHGMWQYQSWAVLRATDSVKLDGTVAPKIYVMPHGMLDPWFQRSSSRKFKAFRNMLIWEAVERRLVSSVNAVLFTCEQEKLLARKTFSRYAPRRESVVGLGIVPPPTETSSMGYAFRRSCPHLSGRDYFLYLGRIDAKKGVDLLVEAYIRIFMNSRISKEKEIDLVIAGPGIESHFGTCILSAAATAIDESGRKRIHFPGMLEGDAKWGAFYGCEAFILPSHQENFGIAVVEALACDKLVLISKSVNIWHEIVLSGGGLAEDDTVEGCMRLFQGWRCRDPSLLNLRPRACFAENFLAKHAASRLVSSISAIP